MIAGGIPLMPPIRHEGPIDINGFTTLECIQSANPQIVQDRLIDRKGENLLAEPAAERHRATKVATVDEILEDSRAKAT